MAQHKQFPVFGFKAIDGQPGVYEGIVAVFNNVDLVNDRIIPGAFEKSLRRWKDSGDLVPYVFSHLWDNIDAICGDVLEAEEWKPGDARLPEELKDLGGLWTKFKIDLEEEYGRKVDRRLAKRRVREFSFAYDTIVEKRAEDGANELIELDLIEIGSTLKGANPATQLLSMKSRLAGGIAKEFEIPQDKADAFVESALAATGEKAWVTLEGSYEDQIDRVRTSAKVWADAKFGRDLYWAGLEATYPDRAVIYAEFWDAEFSYYEVPYTVKKNEITWGEPKEVAIRGVLAAKAFRHHERYKSAVVTEAKPEEPSQAKAEEPRKRPLSLLVELEALEA